MNADLALIDAFLKESPVDAARSMERLPDDELLVLARDLENDALIAGLNYFTAARALAVFDSLETDRKVALLTEAPSRLSLSLLASLDPSARDELYAALPKSLREDLIRQQDYGAPHAESLMRSERRVRSITAPAS